VAEAGYIRLRLGRGEPRLQFQLDPSVALICFALCVAQCVYLVASFVQGSWIADSNGQQIATDFVNVWASGRQGAEVRLTRFSD